jgi:hypothetical protein
MLKPWSCSNVENSPATPSIKSASRAVSSLVSAMGKMSTSIDRRCGGQLRLVVRTEDGLRANDDDLGLPDDLAGRADRVLKLVAPHQPATSRTSRRCSSGSRPDMGETSRISIESRSRPVKTRAGRAGRRGRPDAASGRDSARAAGPSSVAQAVKVALDRRPPLLEALAVQERREPPVQLPRAAFRASQLGHDGTTYDLESKAHAGQQPVELIIADVDLAREEAADARLAHAAEPGQVGRVVASRASPRAARRSDSSSLDPGSRAIKPAGGSRPQVGSNNHWNDVVCGHERLRHPGC